MSAWETVYDLQTELWNFYHSERGQGFSRGFRESRKLKGSWAFTDKGQEVDLASIELGRLYRADPIYIAPEMGELIKVAAETFEPEPLLASDLITPSGFVIFPEPFVVTDANFKKVTWRAALWHSMTFEYSGHTERGILVSMYSHLDDQDIDPDLESLSFSNYPAKLALLHIAPWDFNRSYADFDERAKLPLRQLQAFFRISQQTITTPEPRVPSRATVRRAKRAKLPTKNVTVIRLRRPRTKPQHEGEPIQHDHRWIVRGHWRNQWYPASKVHRQIWISEFIKGPENKPLRITERRAFELVQ